MEFYQKGASTSIGGSAVAVPGQMKGLWELHQKYGRLEWSKLLEPSIRLAEGGMEMREDLRDVSMVGHTQSRLQRLWFCTLHDLL